MSLRVGLLLLACVTMAVPAASGQAVVDATLVLDGAAVQGNPIVPDRSHATVSIPWTYTVMGGPVASGGSEFVLTWSAPKCAHPGIQVTGAATKSFSIPPGESSHEDESTFRVTVTPEVPGETQLRCTFAASVAAPNAAVRATSEESTEASIVAAYLPGITATVDQPVRAGGPQQLLEYNVTVSNHGNARTAVSFRFLGEATGGWTPVAPSQLVLESASQGGEDVVKTVAVRIATPFRDGWNDDSATFRLEVMPSSTKDPSQVGAPVVVSLLATSQGMYPAQERPQDDGKDAPGAGNLAVLAAFALGAMARRK